MICILNLLSMCLLLVYRTTVIIFMFIFYPVTLLNSPISSGPYLPPSPLFGSPGLATLNYLLIQEQKNIAGEKKNMYIYRLTSCT